MLTDPFTDPACLLDRLTRHHDTLVARTHYKDRTLDTSAIFAYRTSIHQPNSRSKPRSPIFQQDQFTHRLQQN